VHEVLARPGVCSCGISFSRTLIEIVAPVSPRFSILFSLKPCMFLIVWEHTGVRLSLLPLVV